MLAGQHVAITGATRGLGRALALAAARRGARVAVGHRPTSEGAACALLDELEGTAAHLAFPIDLADGPRIPRAIDEALGRIGRLDVWISNAAVVHPQLLVVARDEGIEDEVQVNLLGAIRCARAVLPLFLRQRAGTLVHVGSIAATDPARGQSVYAATKGALESFTRALAVEYGRKGVRTLCLRPGAIDTDMLAPTRALAGDALGVPIASPDAIAERALDLVLDPDVPNGATLPLGMEPVA